MKTSFWDNLYCRYGFRIFQESEVSFHREALEDLLTRGAAGGDQEFPLLTAAPKTTESLASLFPSPPPSSAPAPFVEVEEEVLDSEEETVIDSAVNPEE